jgi:glutamate-ammonia-ligase adenylyltransferase
MRLRPNGASGLLVSSMDAFMEYQQRDAWTWEHQALLRARAIAGGPELIKEFDNIRRVVLGKERDPQQLKTEISRMRERMREELCDPDPDKFDIKQGKGGITDIEFMVQYAVLRWATNHPELLDVTANLRLLEAFAQSGLMDPHDCNSLHDAYFAYRAATHRLALQQQPALAGNDEFVQYRSSVIEIWNTMIKGKQE